MSASRSFPGAPVKPDEESYYDLPSRSDETAHLYDHCLRAITNGLQVRRARLAAHGLR